MQTEVVTKFTGSTVIGIYPSATAVSDWMVLDCVGLVGQIVLIGLKVTGRTWSWTLSFSTRYNCGTLPCFICYCNLQHTTVQHIEHLNTHSDVLSAYWVTVAVITFTTNTDKCTFPLDNRHSVRVEYVKVSTLKVNVGYSCETSVNSSQTKRIVLYGFVRWERGSAKLLSLVQ